jgi:hypothetical protein
MVKLSGGGISSNKYRTSKAPKVEPRSKAVSPGAVDGLGQATAFKKPNLQSGPGYSTKPQPSTGIANARQGHQGAGPGGGGRTIFPSGSQSQTPPARPMPAGRNTLSEFGPDIPGRK